MAFENSNFLESKWSVDQLRLMTKISVMYYEEGVKQPEISQQLNLSQSRVSRYLNEAALAGIIRTTIVQPFGIYVGLEKALEEKYGLQEVVIVENIEGAALKSSLGSAAATYLETTLSVNEHIGISSWSQTLLSMVETMRSRPRKIVSEVVQLIGGVGSTEAQIQASRLCSQLAQITSAVPYYLAAPGVTSSKEVKDAFLSDSEVMRTIDAWKRLSTVILGVGAFPASPLLAASGNSIGQKDELEIKKAGAVGEICLRYFDKGGRLMYPQFEERVIAIDFQSLSKIKRRIGVAGGVLKLNAIRAAILGGWINVLITDSEVARLLLEPPRQKKYT